MLTRSNTLQEIDENTADSNSTCLKKRKAEQCERKTPAAKKQSYEIQNRWEEGDVSSCVLVETPHKELEETINLSGFKHFRFKNLFVKPSPLPCLRITRNDSQKLDLMNGTVLINQPAVTALNLQENFLMLKLWASSDDVWIKMLNKELKYIHDKTYLQQHPSLQPKMRAILLEWLLQVSEVYMLHRETFYLAQDFFDRFMLTQVAIGKDQLQLIGITALFIASKLEEIYPPKLQEFAYVTDGACDEDEILEMELIMLKALNWHLCPETPISWLKLYAQVASLKEEPNFLVPQFSQETFIQITQLLDLCTLDINSLDYQYGVLAAAAFCHFTSIETVEKVSGLTWDSISSCVRWMAPFVRTVNAYGQPKLKNFRKVAAEDWHNIQTHVDYLSMLNDAQQRQQENLDRLSPVSVAGLLTPPKSTEKPMNVGMTPETGTAVFSSHHLAVSNTTFSTPSSCLQRTSGPYSSLEKSLQDKVL